MTIENASTTPLETESVLEAYSASAKILLTLGMLACVALFFAGARLLGIPARPGFSTSLLQQPHWMIAIIGVAVMLLASGFVGSLLASRVHHDAGLFCATIGLAVLSARGGPMRYVLFDSESSAVFLSLASELLLLAAFVTVCWLLVEQFFGRRPGTGDLPGANLPTSQKLFTSALQVATMALLILLLCQSDSKAQCLAGVGIAALVATLIAHWFFPAAPSPWLWSGPLIVGLIGYVNAYFRARGIELGRVTGPLAPLARPIPLDYASLGVAGALMGYWTATRWHRAAAAEKAREPQEPARDSR